MRKLLIAVGSAIALALPGALQGTVAAQAAGAPNACKLTGVTKALAAKLYGKGASIASSATEGGEPPNLGATCGIDQAAGAAHYIGGIYVEPYSGEEFSALLASYGQLTQTPLKGLGPGAVFAHDAEPANDVVLFKSGI